jgi:2-methylisocitrate lyase-like PEP mutase family enzyme
MTIVDDFLALHVKGRPLLIPNPWDIGSARLLAAVGFRALATTSSGFAASVGRLDGRTTRDEGLEHAAAIVRATPLPVSADLEHGYADDPAELAQLVRDAAAVGLAGCSIEDSTGRAGDPIYEAEFAVRRIAVAAQAAHEDGHRIVLTARAENYLHGRPDLADTIARLRAYQDAGADVLYAPGLSDPADIAAVVDALDRPVNVLARPGAPSVARLAELGVARISVGGAFAYAAIDGLVTAARELMDDGTYGYAKASARGRAFVAEALAPYAD